MQFHADITETIGSTPLVRLGRLASDLECDLLAKIEFFNPGGSVKDRIGKTIIEDAERTGRLLPGGTIVEATSGNTGVGLAIAAAVKGYRCIFVMPDKMSDDKIRLLRAYGARVVITPTAVEPDDPRSYYSVADRLVGETPGAILADQYHNPINPQSHYDSTGPEIWEQTDGKVTHVVLGMGTGGTITGVGRFLKEMNPAIKIIGADPFGSILYELHRSGTRTKAESYHVEGIGEDFLPSTTDLSVVDDIIQVTDRDSFLTARRLVREEGIFGGGSSGTAVAAALEYCRLHVLGRESCVVVLLPDSGSRYLTKLYNDDWMREYGYLESVAVRATANDIHSAKAAKELITCSNRDRVLDVVGLFKQYDISQAPVLDGRGNLLGIVSEIDLLNHILAAGGKVGRDATIENLIDSSVPTVDSSTALEEITLLLASKPVVLIVENSHVEGILTRIDVLDYLSAS